MGSMGAGCCSCGALYRHTKNSGASLLPHHPCGHTVHTLVAPAGAHRRARRCGGRWAPLHLGFHLAHLGGCRVGGSDNTLLDAMLTHDLGSLDVCLVGSISGAAGEVAHLALNGGCVCRRAPRSRGEDKIARDDERGAGANASGTDHAALPKGLSLLFGEVDDALSCHGRWWGAERVRVLAVFGVAVNGRGDHDRHGGCSVCSAEVVYVPKLLLGGGISSGLHFRV
mmetsp:Transcript_26718/g.72106  ORF Transcript_26718/g.72106 Transcript_26718/m.72106 type:complete len:226 (-) Transcript_26718:202-879(-)